MDNIKKSVGILTWERYEGRKNIGSSRIRGRWVANHWPEAEIFQQGKEYDTVIYQKSYWVEHAKVFKGIKIFDICDADFLHYGYRTIEMINECDAVTCSSQALVDQFKKFTDKPVYFVLDRLDLDYFKINRGPIEEIKTAVWYGYSTNFVLLRPILSFLVNLRLNLTVISDSNFDAPSVYNGKILIETRKWTEETVNDDIISGDIVLNPFNNTGRWRFKSNNKTINAMALGMPVASSVKELTDWIKLDKNERNKKILENTAKVREEYNVDNSVKQYKDIIKELKDAKNK